ncbi:glycosyltransferase family 2 protein [Candidatus Kuenenbacteria bacterium]|nr:glycosyltransferase family 2 protein [Candidatus Kuenenbacteria bacterium]
MDLSIIIVSWRVRDLLRQCLRSIYQKTAGLQFEVFVVDNNSLDGTIELIKDEFPDVHLIVNPKNFGFAKANNQAIKLAAGRHILLLNPDTEFFDNALGRLVELMDKSKEWGIAGCRILNSDRTLQPSVRRFPGWFTQALILLKLHHLPPFKKFLRRYLASDFNYQSISEVEQVMGAFFAIRRETLDIVGLLDEKYFFWFEEVDYCRRAKNLDLKVIYTPEPAIIHHGAGSFRQLDWQKQIIWNHSLQHYFWLHGKRWQWFILWLLQPLSILLALLADLWRR